MKKAFSKYLFPFLILMLGGFINLYADSQETSVANDACYLQNLDDQHSSATFNTLQLGLEKRHCAEIDVEEQEEREEELASHSFSIEHGSTFTASLIASWGQLFLESNSNFGLSHPKLSSPVKKYVRFQVFRI
ncbi:MAG: hypothetical protein VX798_08500 [Bacteroidota bacterium]|uniref:Secreted protein n=1 Tax=Flagellimonas profundi TaxID=2915620 RepID=A0ABS3FDU0_9FLAO|nr:hypothetical protein [Allomuricauda profundi]MBO0341323.1 hypothetical protein [Allomuricauda profundi]MEC7771210.1 hypothetical protein [Bacteroidota bacterium]